MKKIIALLGGASVLLSSQTFALSVSTNSDAATLASTVAGSGINIIGGSESYTDQNGGLASGTFTDGTVSGIGIESGIILTTGDAASAEGPNTADNTSGSGVSASLSFDFTTDTGNLFFNYVFASEEYNEFTNLVSSLFNDSFELRVDDVNVALIPGTNDPVSISNVNGGNPLGVDASNPQFFNNNDLDDGGPLFDIEYDGFTDVFTAEVTNLEVGQEYTMEFFITDVADSEWDSAVFIEAGSFSGVDNSTVPDSGVDNSAVPESGSTFTLFAIGIGIFLSVSKKINK